MNIDEILDEVQLQGINLLDIGSSGHPSPRWSKLAPWINLIGFDPNEEECKRLEKLDLGYRKTEYIPVALGVPGERSVLQITKDPYCISLLPPNQAWLDRFAFGHHFTVIDQRSITTAGIDATLAPRGVRVDIMKMDAQGAELQILAWSERAVSTSFAIEIESGFTENYVGESTFEKIATYLKERNFLMFDINPDHRVARRNHVGETLHGGEQILWCESLWLRDLVAEARKGQMELRNWSRHRALTSLAICWSSNCPDFGLEIAEMFVDMEILSSTDIRELRSADGWRSQVAPLIATSVNQTEADTALLHRIKRLIGQVANRHSDRT